VLINIEIGYAKIIFLHFYKYISVFLFGN